MTDSVIQPPTKEILALCDDADLLIERYLACLDTIKGTIRHFEAETEAYTILKLLIRHLESICQLARHDLVLLPSAVVIARSAFEASVRARWMLNPIDPYEREVRWVLHLRSAAKHWGRLEREPYAPKDAAQSFGRVRHSFEHFGVEISKLLADRGYSFPGGQVPDLRKMLKTIQEPQLYKFYILLSAYAHTNFEAGTLYRKNLGSGKELGEFINAEDWHLPLQVAWKSFFLIARDFLYCVEADMAKFSGDTLLEDFELHLSELTSKQH